jgi:hypothetical protein
MRALMIFVVAVVFACSAFAAGTTDIDESKLSPEAKALKAKYDEALKKLQDDFAAELAALQARVDKVEKTSAAPAKKNWYDNILINGYMQMRYWARDYKSTNKELDDFGIRRFYMNVIATHEKGQIVATYAGAGSDFREGANADWENLFIDYRPKPEFNIRAGLAPNFFGLDACESSAPRLPPERALVAEGNTTLDLVGLYAYGPSDLGLWLMYDKRPKPHLTTPIPNNPGLRVDFTVHNGQYEKTDKNNNKNVGLDVEYFTNWGQFGASWLDGKYTRTLTGGSTVTEPRKAFGLNFRAYPNMLVKGWGFQGEWIDGEWLGTDRDGWYGQASYHFKSHPGVAYTRYERFDPNDSAAKDDYKGLHLGYKYNLTPQDQLTLEYCDGEVGDKTADDLIMQYQRSY